MECKPNEPLLAPNDGFLYFQPMSDLPLPEHSQEATGRRLRRVRRMLKLSQGAIAEKYSSKNAAVSGTQQGWGFYERGERAVPIELAVLIAQDTGIPLDWLYRGVEHFLPSKYRDELLGPDPTEKPRKSRTVSVKSA